MAEDCLARSCAFCAGYGCLDLSDLALSKTGRFTSDLMRFPQIGEGGFIPHDPKSRMGLIEASEVAWQVGQVNAAQRFAFVGGIKFTTLRATSFDEAFGGDLSGNRRISCGGEIYQDTGIEPALPGLGNRSTSIIGLRGLCVGRLDSGKTGRCFRLPIILWT